MQKIHIAIAGFGMSAKTFHMPFLDLDPRFQVCKVFERQTENAKKAYPYLEVVHHFDQLLTPDIDLVIITTPNLTHYEMAKKAILAGKHVIVEKPLAIYAKQAEELDLLAKQHNVMLSVYQNRRWDNGALTVKKLLKHKMLGDIVRYEMRYERFSQKPNSKAWKETGEFGTGLVYDLGVHLIDHCVDLFGIPTALYADMTAQRPDAKSEDNFDITFYYPDKKVVLSATKCAREPAPYIILQGTQGSYIKPTIDNQEALLLKGIKPQGNWNTEPEKDWGLLHTEVNGMVIRSSIESERGNYQAYYDNIYTALTEKAPLQVTAQQAIQVLKLIELIYQSAEEKTRINITK
ncbi:Gfo/Idh/MocA family oxidoreductase [Avibacterium paragallinarum]|uniref:Oxidoreductase n=1 Tax=Avibacterium paragallinarum TaxID=728 RepID=A0AAE5WGX6_AVIPA|nr:Gfo/Idh/MocA family oxidoreductase [Avibacterium paragallinarum]MEE3609343.1 Gfo/Idh/MocA family oxidoreductase [Avibacterium paragallinarum]MEE3621934.1 Gfo/Idh/MocA family oxidoreductase [Avibacterium paragallinarum]MEE3669781.1 Gfo/Idh/MocA family oxidoreductase [Avibacterium paragallinarum]MEE3681891.1 Gfo/Idh/MocA family oxidoreductase [Avibacterium paragallinarum]MEE4386619.1 Gfo/Idh/MocA family oxidoreductase [Avibacterium paragallinarum]